MISRVHVVACVLAGCTNGAPSVIHLEGRAGVAVSLSLADDLTTIDEASYRWEVADVPQGSRAVTPPGTGASTRFIPDMRGEFVVERWLQYGVGERLTHQFVIDSSGRAPTANIVTSVGSVFPVGQSATFDGSGSTSAEGLALAYEWGIPSKPVGSTAEIVGSGAMVSVPLDLPGNYTIQLIVEDDVPSEPAMKVILAQ